MAEHGVAALSHPPSGERVRTGPADPSGAWDQDHPPSTETTTQESGLRENRTSRLSERTEEGRKPDLLRLYNVLPEQSLDGDRVRPKLRIPPISGPVRLWYWVLEHLADSFATDARLATNLTD